MLSLQLALKEIGDDNIIIFPRDSGFNNQAKLIQSINSLRDENVKIVIGPINFDDFEKLNSFRDMLFISPSNTEPKVQENILSIGISLESQIKTLDNFLSSQGKKKTVIMYPKNEYMPLVDKKLSNMILYHKKIVVSPITTHIRVNKISQIISNKKFL